MIALLRWCIRIAGIVALVLGLLVWGGIATPVNLHMTAGGIVAAALAILAIYAIVIRVRFPLAIVSIVWAVATVYVGVMQAQWLPGSVHWIIEAIHLLLGVGAMGMAEALAGALSRRA